VSYTRRDLTIVPLDGENCLVIACDSCGDVGLKTADVLKLSPHIAAKFAARVALTEVLCAGAKPIVITNGVANEMQPTAEATIRGIREELAAAGLSITITGSTEENFATTMTAIATTVIGICKRDELRFAMPQSGDKLYLLGTPKVGTEVDIHSPGFYSEISDLLSTPDIKEIVPVGSKGIEYEANVLCGENAKLFETGICYKKSAGPATCLLVLADENAMVRSDLIHIGNIK